MNAENSDVVCVNETWLNQNISNSEILYSGFTIFRQDRSYRGVGGVFIAIKTASFKAVKGFKPESEAGARIGASLLQLFSSYVMGL